MIGKRHHRSSHLVTTYPGDLHDLLSSLTR